MRKERGITTPGDERTSGSQYLRAVLDCLPTGVYLVGSNGKIPFWNDSAERTAGYLRHDVIGLSCRENILAQCNPQHCGLYAPACPLTGIIMHEGKASHALMFFSIHKVTVCRCSRYPVANQAAAYAARCTSLRTWSMSSFPCRSKTRV